VTEEIRALSAQYAADPSSLVFLRLGEALRARGQADAALKVVLQGLSRYPHLPEAHDLHARILVDRRDFAGAFDEWDMVLRLVPHHVGAHKGIGFLYYRAGEMDRALYHLRTAAELDPEDVGLHAAVERVAGGGEIWDTPMPEAPVDRAPLPTAAERDADLPFADLPGGSDRLLLVDHNGFPLGGGIRTLAGADVSEQAAATLASIAREASRATRLLAMGEWSHLSVECADVSACILNPTVDSTLLAVIDAGTPGGQLAFAADRAAKSARAWLERQR
jgi:tetratricopeptide (TPR) repeat protein